MVQAVAEEYMSIWNHSGEWTEADYLALPPASTPKIELIDGRLLVSASPRQIHQQMMARLAIHLETRAPRDLTVAVELNVRVRQETILIPDVVATYESGANVVVHDPRHVLLVAEVLSPSNRDGELIRKSDLYAKAKIPWYLLVKIVDDEPTLILQRLKGATYSEHAQAVPGEILTMPEPLGTIDPADLLRR